MLNNYANYSNPSGSVVTETVGSFGKLNESSFDAGYREMTESFAGQNISFNNDISQIIKNDSLMDSVKKHLIGNLADEEIERSVYESQHEGLYDQLSALIDNKRGELIQESQTAQLLPIKAIDFPILVKQFIKLVSKDIIKTEVTKTPIIKKAVEQTYLKDKATGQEWEYPQCYYNNEFKNVFNAGKGKVINPSGNVTAVPAANYDVVANLVTGAAAGDKFTIDLKIEKVQVTVTTTDPGAVNPQPEKVLVTLPKPITVDLATAQFVNGAFKATVTLADDTTQEVSDFVSGMVDFATGKVAIVSGGTVTGVVFSGYVNNENNSRAVTTRYDRKYHEWKIEDGFRADSSWSLEQLQDGKSLLDVDFHTKSYNTIADVLGQMEDSQVLAWLDEQFDKYKGATTDPLGFNGFSSEEDFNCSSVGVSTVTPSEYIQTQLKFRIENCIRKMMDNAKMEDFTFVVYGNPRLIGLLQDGIKWISKANKDTVNGIKMTYSYGILTVGGIDITIVSTLKANCNYDSTSHKYSGLRIVPIPLNDEQLTFTHFKYSTSIVTNNDSAYRDASLPGGSSTYIMGTSRYVNASVQAIQTNVTFSNLEQWID